MEQSNIYEIESKIGYVFKDKELLKRAFTHSSAEAEATKNYQSMEFLGDSILDFIIAEKLMELHPQAHEGQLTTLRAGIVSKIPLAIVISHMDVAKFLTVGKGESVEHISEQPKIKSDIFEAITAAIYIDSGRNVDEARKFVLNALESHFGGKYRAINPLDYKSRLNEFSAKNDLSVEYKLTGQYGKPHDPTFVSAVIVNGDKMGEGTGGRKQDSEQNAAREALKSLGQ